MNNPARAFVPFSQPSIGNPEVAAVERILRSGWITSGQEVEAFEQEFAAYCGSAHAIAVSSATAGIDLVLAAMDLQADDEIIVPSLNWVSGPNMIECNGARCRFVDIDLDTLQLNTAHVEDAINPHTRGIMPVHFAGHPCDLTALRALATQHDLLLIEDAAHAHGARHAGTPIGADSSVAIFSFHPSKNMTTGEGGMIVCNDPLRAAALRQQRFHGIQKNAWNNRMRSGSDGYDVITPSRKYNMTDIAAAIGRCQLAELEQRNQKRRDLAHRYLDHLAALPIIKMLQIQARSGDLSVWHIFPVMVQLNDKISSRAAFASDLAVLQIGTGLHYPAVHSQTYYRNKYGALNLPQSAHAGERLLSLPLFPDLSYTDQDRVISALTELNEKYL